MFHRMSHICAEVDKPITILNTTEYRNDFLKQQYKNLKKEISKHALLKLSKLSSLQDTLFYQSILHKLNKVHKQLFYTSFVRRDVGNWRFSCQFEKTQQNKRLKDYQVTQASLLLKLENLAQPKCHHLNLTRAIATLELRRLTNYSKSNFPKVLLVSFASEVIFSKKSKDNAAKIFSSKII